MSKPIIDCKFFNCAINNGSGTCVSTLLIKCSKIPNHFNMGDGLSQFQCDCCGEMKEGTGFFLCLMKILMNSQDLLSVKNA